MKKIITIICLLLSISSFSQSNYLKTFPGVSVTSPNNILQTNDDGFLAIGTKDSSLYILKTDSLAEKTWDLSLKNKNKFTVGIKIIALSDSSFLALGLGSRSIYLAKFTIDGDTLWTANFPHYTYIYPYDLIKTNKGDIIVVGSYGSTSFISKISENRELIKSGEFNCGYRFNYIYEIGNYYYASCLSDSSSLLKFNYSCDTIWKKTLPNIRIECMLKTSNDKIVVNGNISGVDYSKLIGIDTTGEILFNSKHGYYNDLSSQSINSLTDSTFMIVGSLGSSSHSLGFCTKFSENGEIYDYNQFYDKISSICFYSSVALTSTSFVLLGTKGSSMMLLRTSPQGSFNPVTEFTDSPQVQVYPSPAKDKVTLEFPAEEFTNMEVFNANGIKVFTQEIYDSSTTLDVSTYANGLYYIKLSSKEHVAMKKFVVER